MSEMVDKGKEVGEKAKTPAVAFLTDVRTNFRAGEGTAGFAAVKSRFANLLKSGINGKVAIIGCVVALTLIIKNIRIVQVP